MKHKVAGRRVGVVAMTSQLLPAGGLFTGVEGIKTPEQAELWGGTAGVAYDPCYHAAYDTLGNVDRVALDQNLDAAAWATGLYGYSTEDINGVPPRRQRALLRQDLSRKAAFSTGHAELGVAA